MIDRDERLQITVRNSVLVHRARHDAALPTLRITRDGLLAVLFGSMRATQSAQHDLLPPGRELAPLEQLAGLLEHPALEFNIIEP